MSETTITMITDNLRATIALLHPRVILLDARYQRLRMRARGQLQ